MEGWAPVVISIIIVVALIAVIRGSCHRNNYHILGSAYRPETGGERAEFDPEECYQHPGYRFCSLTDGTPGVCMLSGMCHADVEQDLRQLRDDLPLPLCHKPIFKQGCNKFCRCKNMAERKAGVEVTPLEKCERQCHRWYSPL